MDRIDEGRYQRIKAKLEAPPPEEPDREAEKAKSLAGVRPAPHPDGPVRSREEERQHELKIFHATADAVRDWLAEGIRKASKKLAGESVTLGPFSTALLEVLEPICRRLERLEDAISTKADCERIVEMHSELQAKILASAANSRRGYDHGRFE